MRLVRAGNGPWRMVFERCCEASPERVWRAITEPNCGFWRPDGDRTLLTFRPAEQPLLVIVTGWHSTLDNLARALSGQPRLTDAEFAAREAEVAGCYRDLPGVVWSDRL